MSTSSAAGGPRRAWPFGQRIQIFGNTGAGKSTLAERLAERLDLPFVELDALNFLPGWVALTDTDLAEFERRVASATAGERWVVAGSYSGTTQRVLWPRLETLIWLDLPITRIVPRVIARSWRRWRSRELLWGTNVERLWPQLKLWSDDSLIHWAITQHRRKRSWLGAQMLDPRWGHIRFLRLRSPAEVAALVRSLDAG